MKLRWGASILFSVAVLPVWLGAPGPEPCEAPDTVADLAEACRRSGKQGRELVDEAIEAVARAYPCHSLWHVQITPERSLAEHHGWSHQYNTILLLVLRELGFKAKAVHAARVRGFQQPWWLAGHSWVKVAVDGFELDACASRVDSKIGSPPFVALTPVLPLRPVTRWGVGIALVPFVVAEVWRAWFSGRAVASWVYSPKKAAEAAEETLLR